MNKKTKNIVSVIQSVAKNLGGTQWMPSGSLTALHMTKSTLYSVLCTLCAVLFLASCNDESLVDNPHAQNAFRTVSVDLGMPQGKPAYGDGTDSRAQMADTIATGYRLSFDTAETGKPDASRAGSNNWIDGDRLLLHIVASNADQTTQTTEGMLTLTYSDSKWSLDAVNSYTKYGASFVDYNSAQPKLLITDDDTNIDLANLKMHVDEKIGVSANVTATLFYAPHMKWRLTEGSVTLVVDETASTYEKWEWTNTNTNSSWTTPYARLRVNTGNGNAGDVVTLTSSAFDSAWEVEPTEGEGENAKTVYTATTDAEGNAYFYGRTNGDAALTANFLVELTQMRVPVPTAAPASEGRSITLEDESTLLIDLDEPITLLEASDVVSVKLTATKAYRIEANVKREASAVANLSVIDGGGNTEGTADDVTTVKAQIETAMAADITEFTVSNQLASYSNRGSAGSVVGEAIRQFGLYNVDTKITLRLADATEVIDGAFYECKALQSVSLPVATSIGVCAFDYCTSLMSVSLPEATLIGEWAFEDTALTSVSLPEATSIGKSAFEYCTSLTSVSLPAAETIGYGAFSGCTALMSVSLPSAETIGYGAFSGCIDITEVVADKATMIENCAFDYCTSLMSVSLPETTTISSFAFRGCTALTTVTLPKVEKIFTSAFQKCTSLASVVANSATEIWPSVFSECTGLTSVTFGEVIETIEHDSPGDSPFSDFSTENCDLTLHAAQLNHDTYPVSVSNDGKLMWAGKQWKSITMGDRVYTQMNGFVQLEKAGVTYAVIDGSVGGNTEGTADDVAAVKSQIDAAIAKGITDFIVVNQLARDYDPHEAETVVGQAIHDLASDESSPNYGTISITIADATELSKGAFYECYALKSVTFNQPVAIRGWVFSFCTALTGMDWAKVTKIDGGAFNRCTFTGPITINQGTELVMEAFEGCTITGTLTIGEGGNVDAAAFHDAIVSNCDLVLPADQESNVTVSNGMLMWASAEWKSITVGGVQYKAVGNELYAVIDGTCEDVDKVKVQIQNAPGNAEGKKNILVIDGLAQYSNSGSAVTVVGEAIRICGAADGSISLVLDEGITDIPRFAFQDCNALGSVVANGVETIGYGAFSGTLAIEELTFKKVISYKDNYAFGQQPQDGNYWTFNCTLTLNESQSGVYEGDDIPSLIWGSCFWGCIKIGVYVYYMRS